MLLLLLWGVMAFFCASCMWKQGDKWWQTAIVFAFCYLGLVAATVSIALLITL